MKNQKKPLQTKHAKEAKLILKYINEALKTIANQIHHREQKRVLKNKTKQIYMR